MLLNALVLTGPLAQATTPEEALRRSMERRSPMNVDAILEQASPWGGGYIRFRMWRDQAGRRRTEVISPATMQGQVSVDDGTVWTTYFPDQNRLRIHPSPLLEADDLDFRMRLVRRNYRLEIDQKTSVAGRSALRVVAHPKSSDLETRRFYVDAATFAPLKTESLNDLGGVTVLFAVRRIDYPGRLEKTTFEAPAASGARRDSAHPPVPVRSRDDAERRLGFRSAFPMHLPMGFHAQGVDFVDWHGITPVAIRITDGLVRLNVYQFRRPGGPRPPERPGDDRKVGKDIGDLRVEVRGDAPLAVRARILAAYAKGLEASSNAHIPQPSPTPSTNVHQKETNDGRSALVSLVERRNRVWRGDRKP